MRNIVKRGKRWGYKVMVNRKLYKRFKWDTEAEAAKALEEFRESLKVEGGPLFSMLQELGQPSLKARGADLVCPTVYAVVRGARVIYIGSTFRGVIRPLARHHRREEFRTTDSFLFWRCGSIEAALELEKKMIEAIKPELNITYHPVNRFRSIRNRVAASSALQ